MCREAGDQTEVFDPGGSEFDEVLLRVLHHAVPESKTCRAMLRKAEIPLPNGNVFVEKLTLDTGANSGSYIGGELASALVGATRIPCNHRAKLGDGTTIIQPRERLVVPVRVFDDDDVLLPPVVTSFYVLDHLGMEAIVGLPDILAGYFEFFMGVLQNAANADLRLLDVVPWPQSTVTPGNVVEPWSKMDEAAPEENECPDALAFGEDILRFMELSIDEARQEYLDLLPSRIAPEFLEAVPEVLKFLKGPIAASVFTPSTWEGIKTDPATFTIRGEMPKRLKPSARPVRPAGPF